MRKALLALSAVAMVAPAMVVSTPAEARHTYREYRGRDGRIYCRRSNGTTGTIVGGVGGALVGSAVGGTTATILGAGGGALLGRHIDRHNSRRRCG